MKSIFAGIHLQNTPNEFLPLSIDFSKTVFDLKEQVASRVQAHAANLEIVYNGCALADADQLSGVMKPNATVHCFAKTKKYPTYKPKEDFTEHMAIVLVKELFTVIAHIQINVNSRVNILQKILSEFPEFRRNLGAQALIRDSVLFNTLHQPEVVKKIAENYPIICEAAPFIVDTIKKELTRSSSISNFLEPDSTNSSEEENSVGGGSSASVRSASSAALSAAYSAAVNAAASGAARNAAVNAARNAALSASRIAVLSAARAARPVAATGANQPVGISPQQLRAALAQVDYNSANSLSSISQRNAAMSSSGSNPLSHSTSGDRISQAHLRATLQRALSSIALRGPGTTATAPEPTAPQQMDTSDSIFDSSMEGGDIPMSYQNSPYAEQLRTMAQMGFVNYEENLNYLNITNGNIENAINLLMGSMN